MTFSTCSRSAWFGNLMDSLVMCFGGYFPKFDLTLQNVQ